VNKAVVVAAAVVVLLLPAGLTLTAGLVTAAANAAPCGPAGPAADVAGTPLDPEQLANAATITATTAGRHLPSSAAVVAVATALQESGLRNLPTGDRDSLGLFQQRASWGPATTRLDPMASTGLFLDALGQVPAWEQLPLAVASDHVQHSAHPWAVAKWEATATALVDAYWPAPRSPNAIGGTQSVAHALTVPLAAAGCPGAAPGWLEDLRKFARAGAPETISSTAMSLALVLKSLADERVLDLLCPGAGEGVDVEKFVRDGTDTLYLISEGGDGISTAPLVTAFASAVVSAARRHSQSLPGGRLDPPLTLVLDEAANVAPLPDLPMLMADGGGRGMTTWAFVQSFAQLRARWGRDGADSIWGASCAKLLLGGCTEADDLERVSRVVGDRWARRQSHTSRSGLLPRTDDSTSTSRERERILPVQDLARLPTGTALLLYRSLPPALITLPAWWQRPDAARFTASKASTANASPAATTKRREATA